MSSTRQIQLNWSVLCLPIDALALYLTTTKLVVPCYSLQPAQQPLGTASSCSNPACPPTSPPSSPHCSTPPSSASIPPFLSPALLPTRSVSTYRLPLPTVPPPQPSRTPFEKRTILRTRQFRRPAAPALPSIHDYQPLIGLLRDQIAMFFLAFGTSIYPPLVPHSVLYRALPTRVPLRLNTAPAPSTNGVIPETVSPPLLISWAPHQLPLTDTASDPSLNTTQQSVPLLSYDPAANRGPSSAPQQQQHQKQSTSSYTPAPIPFTWLSQLITNPISSSSSYMSTQLVHMRRTTTLSLSRIASMQNNRSGAALCAPPLPTGQLAQPSVVHFLAEHRLQPLLFECVGIVVSLLSIQDKTIYEIDDCSGPLTCVVWHTGATLREFERDYFARNIPSGAGAGARTDQRAPAEYVLTHAHCDKFSGVVSATHFGPQLQPITTTFAIGTLVRVIGPVKKSQHGIIELNVKSIHAMQLPPEWHLYWDEVQDGTGPRRHGHSGGGAAAGPRSGSLYNRQQQRKDGSSGGGGSNSRDGAGHLTKVGRLGWADVDPIQANDNQDQRTVTLIQSFMRKLATARAAAIAARQSASSRPTSTYSHNVLMPAASRSTLGSTSDPTAMSSLEWTAQLLADRELRSIQTPIAPHDLSLSKLTSQLTGPPATATGPVRSSVSPTSTHGLFNGHRQPAHAPHDTTKNDPNPYQHHSPSNHQEPRPVDLTWGSLAGLSGTHSNQNPSKPASILPSSHHQSQPSVIHAVALAYTNFSAQHKIALPTLKPALASTNHPAMSPDSSTTTTTIPTIRQWDITRPNHLGPKASSSLPHRHRHDESHPTPDPTTPQPPPPPPPPPASDYSLLAFLLDPDHLSHTSSPITHFAKLLGLLITQLHTHARLTQAVCASTSTTVDRFYLKPGDPGYYYRPQTQMTVPVTSFLVQTQAPLVPQSSQVPQVPTSSKPCNPSRQSSQRPPPSDQSPLWIETILPSFCLLPTDSVLQPESAPPTPPKGRFFFCLCQHFHPTRGAPRHHSSSPPNAPTPAQPAQPQVPKALQGPLPANHCPDCQRCGTCGLLFMHAVNMANHSPPPPGKRLAFPTWSPVNIRSVLIPDAITLVYPSRFAERAPNYNETLPDMVSFDRGSSHQSRRDPYVATRVVYRANLSQLVLPSFDSQLPPASLEFVHLIAMHYCQLIRLRTADPDLVGQLTDHPDDIRRFIAAPILPPLHQKHADRVQDQGHDLDGMGPQTLQGHGLADDGASVPSKSPSPLGLPSGDVQFKNLHGSVLFNSRPPGYYQQYLAQFQRQYWTVFPPPPHVASEMGLDPVDDDGGGTPRGCLFCSVKSILPNRTEPTPREFFEEPMDTLIRLALKFVRNSRLCDLEPTPSASSLALLSANKGQNSTPALHRKSNLGDDELHLRQDGSGPWIPASSPPPTIPLSTPTTTQLPNIPMTTTPAATSTTTHPAASDPFVFAFSHDPNTTVYPDEQHWSSNSRLNSGPDGSQDVYNGPNPEHGHGHRTLPPIWYAVPNNPFHHDLTRADSVSNTTTSLSASKSRHNPKDPTSKHPDQTSITSPGHDSLSNQPTNGITSTSTGEIGQKRQQGAAPVAKQRLYQWKTRPPLPITAITLGSHSIAPLMTIIYNILVLRYERFLRDRWSDVSMNHHTRAHALAHLVEQYLDDPDAHCYSYQRPCEVRLTPSVDEPKSLQGKEDVINQCSTTSASSTSCICSHPCPDPRNCPIPYIPFFDWDAHTSQATLREALLEALITKGFLRQVVPTTAAVPNASLPAPHRQTGMDRPIGINTMTVSELGRSNLMFLASKALVALQLQKSIILFFDPTQRSYSFVINPTTTSLLR